MSDIEIYTDRYEREHGRKPLGRGFWRFTVVSPTITAKDHPVVIDSAMTYDKALEVVMEIARRRRSERIIVEP